MYRSSICLVATFFAFVVSTSAPAFQQQQRVPQQRQQAAPQPKVSPELWKLLDDWSKGSGRINYLSGKHERHVYDGAFEVEKVSNGKFWYASPDKGRIDVSPINITQQMLDARNAPDAQVERKRNGKPYDLKSDDPERWLCNGEKVFDIDDPNKTARVVGLPPDQRGKSIMNTPLPFLFGMPPEDAIDRFKMRIEKDYRPDYNVVLLSAIPRQRKDLDNWRSAQIYLDTKSYLPTAIKLVDPAGTKRTVYKFKDMKTGKGVIDFLKDPWNPRIGGYKVHVIHPGEQQKVAANRNPGPSYPNVVGQLHNIAEQMLIQAGVPKQNISKQNAGPAPRANLMYLVREQEPLANARLNKQQKVVLMVYDKPLPANGQRQGSTTQRAQQRAGKVTQPRN